MKEFILKQSKAENAGRVGVIKVKKNNLSGDFIELDKLGKYEYRFYPEKIGIYRIINNASAARDAIKGCILVYKYNGRSNLKFLRVTDKFVKEIPDVHFEDANHINELGTDIYNSRFGSKPDS